ncbi:MAG TPA: hypothetical protein PLF78_11425 [Caulobacter sp.]|nr:hypothetical protein [Caulobacter sp.]
MDKPDAAERRDDLDHMSRPRLTPRPDGGGGEDEPMADALKRGDDEGPEETAETPDQTVPLTESERTSRESLADLIPSSSAEPSEGEGQVTPPIAP